MKRLILTVVSVLARPAVAGCAAVAISAGLFVPASAVAAVQPGPPSYFSGPPGSAMTVTAGNGGSAAQLTSVEPGGGYGGVSVSFPAGVDFSTLTTLSTSYDMTQGSCGLGAPRFQIDLADASNNYIGTLYAYIGPDASLNGDPCPAADNAWATQPNVATSSDPDVMRWDFQANAGGPVPSNTLQSYSSEEVLLGGYQMLDAQIVDDGAPYAGGTQQVEIQNWNVNGTMFFAPPPPCPTGTKANFRWHYSPNGSDGDWSKTTTAVCPSSLTMGPQAMEGDLKVSPGTTLKAGYDFNVPGNKSSLSLTVSNPTVVFKLACMGHTTPSPSTLSVPMPNATYSVTNDKWVPSGDQKSPLVYQGSTTVPNACAGGQVRLNLGGTFTASVG